MPSKDVHVRLHYINEQHTGGSDTGKSPKRKLGCRPNALSVLETIHDVRGAHEKFDIDLQGFCYVKAPIKLEGLTLEQETTDALLPEVEDLLRQKLDGCDEIHVVGIRGSDHIRSALVHVDYTASSVESLLHETYKTKANYLFAGRVRLIDIWRPINNIPSRSPIAIADARGVDLQKDISRIDTGTPMRHAFYRDKYHWYYMSEQAEEDILMFKAYDSDKSLPSTTCLRTTFDIPNTPTETVSGAIDIQLLIFTHPASKQIAHDRQSELEIESLKRRITILSDEVSQSQALVRAGLNLRQWESSKTAEQMRHLVSDRDHSRAESLSLSMQLKYLEDWITNLYMWLCSSPHYEPLVERMQYLICSTPRLHQRLGQNQQAHINFAQSMGLYGPDAEVLLLRQQLQAQCAENRRLKARLNPQIEDAMSEALDRTQHERGEDDAVIEDLRREVKRL